MREPSRAPEPRPPFLRLQGVSKRFGGVVALDHVDFDVYPGEVHCLAGENGSGKSTLIKIVSGVHEPDPGSHIEVAGQTFESLTPAIAKAMGIEVIFQDLSLFPNLSVAENIGFEAALGGLARIAPRAEMRERATAVMRRLGFDLPLDQPVGRLSIAQRQVVAICRGLASHAKLLFMDEPTASLTRHEVDTLIDVVERLTAEGIAIVFVSHKLDEVIEVADRVTVLRDGRKVGTFPAAEMDDRRLGELMTGQAIEHAIVAEDVSRRPVVLSVQNLTRRGEYEDVSFELRKGEVLGLIGLLGAGRTELALSLFGMTHPDSGVIRLDGKEVALATNQEAINAGIAYVSEDRLTLGLNMRQSVEANTVLAVLRRLAGPLGYVPPSKRRAEAGRWVDRLKIKIPSLDAPVQQLSGGNQQRVVLAKWLATEPKVLILDSPTVGVDIGNKAGIYALVRELSRRGVAILLISDEITEIFATCDRVLHMREGRIIGSYVPGAILEEDLKEHVYA